MPTTAFVTKKHYCDFVVWSSSEIHIEQNTLDKSLIQTANSCCLQILENLCATRAMGGANGILDYKLGMACGAIVRKKKGEK